MAPHFLNHAPGATVISAYPDAVPRAYLLERCNLCLNLVGLNRFHCRIPPRTLDSSEPSAVTRVPQWTFSSAWLVAGTSQACRKVVIPEWKKLLCWLAANERPLCAFAGSQVMSPWSLQISIPAWLINIVGEDAPAHPHSKQRRYYLMAPFRPLGKNAPLEVPPP